jgi:phosphoribosylamine--glycine ligase/phosphoribosylaminoimidazole synthetase
LCNGIVDYLMEECPSLKVFGPTKEQARIEGSKRFSKKLMDERGIPTPAFEYFAEPSEFDVNDLDVKSYDKMVIKYSGLAQGKGVFLPNNGDEEGVKNTICRLFENGDDGIIIEERLTGREVSVLAFCNGEEACLMPPAQDYKRIHDGDTGPNTGGMGALCPSNVSADSMEEIKGYMDAIVKKMKYKGVLYAGIMMVDMPAIGGDIARPYFLEFNCRFGDPEAQVILNLLDSPLLGIITACMSSEKVLANWKDETVAVAVVMAHEDYPIKKLDVATEVKIKRNEMDPCIKIYESNVTHTDKKRYTTGGRVLSVVCTSSSLRGAIDNIYDNIGCISYDGVYFRRDIGCNSGENVRYKENLPKVGIMASGNGTCLEKLMKHEADCIKIIVVDKPDAGVIDKAQNYKIPFLYLPSPHSSGQYDRSGRTREEYDQKIVNIFRQFDIDLVILAGYMRIVSSELFEDIETVNIHPSLLPAYEGMTGTEIHESVIRNGDTISGCTLHRVVSRVDGGKTLVQKRYQLKSDETPASLKENVQALEKDVVIQFVREYSTGKIEYSVDIEEGNEFVEELKKTNPAVGGYYAGYDVGGIQLAATADGVGTKLNIALEYGGLGDIGIDLVAMNVNDLIAGGAKPLFFLDYMAVDSMDKKMCSRVISGINRGCKMAGCELIGGETAEMKDIYMKGKMDLAGFAIGRSVHEFGGQAMTDECILYGIPSSGIHSNGYTLVNKLMKKFLRHFSKGSYRPPEPDQNIYVHNPDAIFPCISDILKPTRIYTELLDMYKTYPSNILGVAHITGGGYKDNLKRILPDHLTFELEEWKFPHIFEWIQRESNLSTSEMLDVFNCGYGMVIISNTELPLKQIGRLVEKSKVP